MNEEVVGEITLEENVTEFNIDDNINTLSEINFTVPSIIQKPNGEEKENPLYTKIDGFMLMSVDDKQMFEIRNPEETLDPHNNIAVKRFTAYSREYQFRDKIVDSFVGEARQLYDNSNRKDDNGVPYGFFNYVEEKTSWRVVYISPDAKTRYRGVNISNSNLLESFKRIEETFDVVITFNTMDKEISILDVEQLGMDSDLTLSSQYLVEEVRTNTNLDGVVTRLYGYGEDGISIQSVNMSGQPFVEDISFFMNEKYMTEELIIYIQKFNKYRETKEGEWGELLNQTLDKDEELVKTLDEIKREEQILRLLNHHFDTLIMEEIAKSENSKIETDPSHYVGDKPIERLTLSETTTEQENVANKIKSLRSRLESLQDEYKNIREQSIALQEQIKFDYFLKEVKKIDDDLYKGLLTELNDNFVKEDIMENNHYTRETILTLKEDMERELSRMCTPTIEFSIDVKDFLSERSTKHWKGKLNLGDVFRLDMTEFDKYSSLLDTYLLELRLIGYTHDPIKKTLNLKFANRYNINTKEMFLTDILMDSRNAASKVNMNEMRWLKGEEVDTEFRKWIQSELDLSKQSIITSDNQKPILDDRGLWLYKQMPDGTISDEQVRAINNVLAITKDNWKTIEVALTPSGVMANQVVGDLILGNDLRILSDSGVVQIMDNLIKITDDRGNLRVALGKYRDDDFKYRYGLQLKDVTGNKTILDDRGIYQVWQDSLADNVDENFPLTMYIYVPAETSTIYKSKLYLRTSYYRGYTRAADHAGGMRQTSSGSFVDGYYGSARTENLSWSSNAQLTTSTLLYPISNPYATDRSKGAHDHGVNPGERVRITGWGGEVQGRSWHASGGHDHIISTRGFEHTHTIDYSASANHLHDVYIDSHTHDIIYGINESRISSRNCNILVNGSYVAVNRYIGSSIELDITQHLKSGMFNEVRIEARGLLRVHATVSVEALVQYSY